MAKIITCAINEHKSLSGLFERNFNWSCRELSMNGIVLQKIIRHSDVPSKIKEKDPDVFDNSYFEYWDIIDSSVSKMGIKNQYYDDNWSYATSQPLGDCIAKYGSSGTVCMQGIVFYIPDNYDVCRKIKRDFVAGSITQAGNLPAKQSIEYEDELKPFYLFTHEIQNKWNFESKESFIDAIIHLLDFQQMEIIVNIKKDLDKIGCYNDLKKKIISMIESSI